MVKFHVVESRKGSPEGKQVTVVGSGNVAGGNVNEAVRGKRFRGVLRWGSQQGDVMLAIQGEKPWGKIAVLDITSQRFNRTACGRALGALYRGGELEFGVAWDGKRVIVENVKVRGEKCALAAVSAVTSCPHNMIGGLPSDDLQYRMRSISDIPDITST